MNKKLLKHNKFVNSVCELVGDEYSVLGEYKTTKTTKNTHLNHKHYE